MQITLTRLGPLQTNCYIVTDEQTKRCAVIDPGADGAELAAALENMKMTTAYIFLTHGHYDHVGGVRALHEATGAPVYLHKSDLTLPESMTDGPLFYTNTYAEGDAVTMDETEFHVIETPGHTPGSVCLIANHSIFSGDTLFEGSCGRTDFPGGSMDQMKASLRRLAELEGDYRVFPGHGPETTLAAERNSNFYMREATVK